MVQLSAFGERKPAQLSGGQRQRVALARALVNRPKVLLLDEPLGALDLKLRQAMQIELKEIQQSVGLTFIYVTHDQEEALTMSDRLAVFNRGQIEQVGTPAEVYERPATGFVAGFVGVSNVLDGAVARQITGDEHAFTIRPEKIALKEPGATVGPEECSASGHVREVVYLGASTRYIVQLDVGGELVVMQQNLTTSSMEALQVRGQAVRLVWEPQEQPAGRRGRGCARGVDGPRGGGSMKKQLRWLAVIGVLALVAAACGSDDDGGGGGGGGSDETVAPAKTYDAIGDDRGCAILIAWNGYTEDGSNDPAYDWVTPFEDETGCKVTVKYADTSDEMVTLMRQGGGTVYDGVSASGDASNRLIAGGDVGAVDPALFPDVLRRDRAAAAGVGDEQLPLRRGRQRVRRAVHVRSELPDVQHRRREAGAHELGRDVRAGAERAPNPYAGKITAYDSAIYIADAAMYLKAHNPDLGITDPYELTQEQLDAATELLEGAGADGREVLGALHRRDRRVRGRLDGGRDRVADQPQLRRGGRSGRSR